MRCSNCGQPLIEGAKFCGKCGTPVAQAASGDTKIYDHTQELTDASGQTKSRPEEFRQHESQRYNQQSKLRGTRDTSYAQYGETLRKKRRESKAPLILGLIIAMGLVAALVLWLVKTPTGLKATKVQADPTETIERFEKALDALDVDKMAECFDAESRESVKSALNSELSEYSTILKVLGFAVDFDLDVTDISYTDDEHCTVALDAAVKAMGNRETTSANLDMVLEDDVWYIDGESSLSMFGEMAAGFMD